jgi:hypothetical protein
LGKAERGSATWVNRAAVEVVDASRGFVSKIIIPLMSDKRRPVKRADFELTAVNYR